MDLTVDMELSWLIRSQSETTAPSDEVPRQGRGERIEKPWVEVSTVTKVSGTPLD